MSRISVLSRKFEAARIGVVIAIAMAAVLCSTSPARAQELPGETARLRVFPEDSEFGITDIPQHEETLDDGALSQAKSQAPAQVIVAPLPPAVLTGLPLLAGMWATRRYRLWRRGA